MRNYGMREWVLMIVVGVVIVLAALSIGDGTFALFGILVVLIGAGGAAWRAASDYDKRRE